MASLTRLPVAIHAWLTDSPLTLLATIDRQQIWNVLRSGRFVCLCRNDSAASTHSSAVSRLLGLPLEGSAVLELYENNTAAIIASSWATYPGTTLCGLPQ